MADLNAPASAYVANRGYAEPTEEDMEAMEEAQDLARARERNTHGVNKVSEFLGQTFYRTNRTWPCLYWKVAGKQVSVELYFPRLNLAVDRFARGDSEQRQEASFKAQQLKAVGVKYKALFPENRLADLRGA